jgi:hypothetical protein
LHARPLFGIARVPEHPPLAGDADRCFQAVSREPRVREWPSGPDVSRGLSAAVPYWAARLAPIAGRREAPGSLPSRLGTLRPRRVPAEPASSQPWLCRGTCRERHP